MSIYTQVVCTEEICLLMTDGLVCVSQRDRGASVKETHVVKKHLIQILKLLSYARACVDKNGCHRLLQILFYEFISLPILVLNLIII